MECVIQLLGNVDNGSRRGAPACGPPWRPGRALLLVSDGSEQEEVVLLNRSTCNVIRHCPRVSMGGWEETVSGCAWPSRAERRADVLDVAS